MVAQRFDVRVIQPAGQGFQGDMLRQAGRSKIVIPLLPQHRVHQVGRHRRVAGLQPRRKWLGKTRSLTVAKIIDFKTREVLANLPAKVFNTPRLV